MHTVFDHHEVVEASKSQGGVHLHGNAKGALQQENAGRRNDAMLRTLFVGVVDLQAVDIDKSCTYLAYGIGHHNVGRDGEQHLRSLTDSEGPESDAYTRQWPDFHLVALCCDTSRSEKEQSFQETSFCAGRRISQCLVVGQTNTYSHNGW